MKLSDVFPKTFTEKLIERGLYVKSTSSWAKKAGYRIKHEKWLRYSSKIALRVITAFDDSKMTRKELAAKTGISTYRLKNIFKGHSNLTLELIGKLSEALEVELIDFPEYRLNIPTCDLKRCPTCDGIEIIPADKISYYCKKCKKHFPNE